MTRRQIIKSLIFAPLLFASSTALSCDGYKVVFQCKKFSKKGRYQDLRHNWCNEKAIIAITERFRKSKDLLSFNYQESSSTLKWTYVFSSESSYRKWNDEMFFSGAFNSLKIDSDFMFKIDSEYVYSLPIKSLSAYINS